MRLELTRVVVPLAALFATGMANAASPTDEERWQAMARADLDAAHARILEAHPGVIDAANPSFKTWVEAGYEEAKTFLPHVVSYDTALAVLRYYTSGFEDGHLVYSDDVRKNFPIWVTGWNIDYREGHYVVVAALPDWPVPLPPVGAVWTGCDDRSPAELLTEFGQFVDRREGDLSQCLRVGMTWMRRPVADNLRECTFRTPSRKSTKLAVAYRAVPQDTFWNALPHTSNGGERAANAFDVEDGVLWVRAGNFNLRAESPDVQELTTMLTTLKDVRGVDTIVFDVRGNRGGDSSIGDRIFDAATGGLEFDQTDLDSLPRYYAQWRVSDYLVDFLVSTTDRLQDLYGADSPRVKDNIAFRDEVIAAKAAGEPWVEQNAGRTLSREAVAARKGHLRRFDGKLALLTDSACVSACLDFADLVLQVPGAMHLGHTTGADSVYMVGSQSRLPSGNRLVIPVKVWRNRPRGNNEALVPDVSIDLTAKETTIRREVLRALKPASQNASASEQTLVNLHASRSSP